MTRRSAVPIAVVVVGAALCLWMGRTPEARPDRALRTDAPLRETPTTDAGVEPRPAAPEMARTADEEEDTSPIAEDGADIRGLLVSLLEAGRFGEAETRMMGVSDGELSAALDAQGTAAFEELYPRLSPAGRRLAAWTLARSQSPEVSGFLVLQLRTEADAEVRQSLVLALQARPDEEAGRGLVQALTSDPAAEVRSAAAHALANRPGRESDARDALITRLESDAAVTVRAAAAAALGRTPSAEATTALMDALGSPIVEVRLAAAQALGGQSGFASADTLAEVEPREPDAGVRSAIAESQRALRGELTIEQVGGCDSATHEGEAGEEPLDGLR